MQVLLKVLELGSFSAAARALRMSPSMVMGEFHRANPELVVELGLTDRVVDLAEEGWDMAIRIGRLASSSLIARKLAPFRMVLCGSAK
jgi:DNA-binding transcriptional LysR family regulator